MENEELELFEIVNKNHEFRKWVDKLNAISARRRKKGNKK